MGQQCRYQIGCEDARYRDRGSGTKLSLYYGKLRSGKAFPQYLPLSSAEEVKVTPLGIGATAPDFTLPGIDDKTHNLAEYAKSDVLMIAFISNHCPSSQRAESRIKKLVSEMRGKSFKLVAINPNHPDGLRPDELGYSKYNDGFDDMKKHAKEQGFNFDYLYDGETQATAKAYGCLATPHVFVFDKERKLRYQGRFDDSRFDDDATVKSTDARNAVQALLVGQPVQWRRLRCTAARPSGRKSVH